MIMMVYYKTQISITVIYIFDILQTININC